MWNNLIIDESLISSSTIIPNGDNNILLENRCYCYSLAQECDIEGNER